MPPVEIDIAGIMLNSFQIIGNTIYSMIADFIPHVIGIIGIWITVKIGIYFTTKAMGIEDQMKFNEAGGKYQDILSGHNDRIYDDEEFENERIQELKNEYADVNPDADWLEPEELWEEASDSLGMPYQRRVRQEDD